MGLPESQFAATCVLIDKLDKLPEEEVRKSLLEVGLSDEAVSTLLATLQLSDFDSLEAALGKDSPALAELRELFTLADAYGVSSFCMCLFAICIYDFICKSEGGCFRMVILCWCRTGLVWFVKLRSCFCVSELAERACLARARTCVVMITRALISYSLLICFNIFGETVAWVWVVWRCPWLFSMRSLLPIPIAGKDHACFSVAMLITQLG